MHFVANNPDRTVRHNVINPIPVPLKNPFRLCDCSADPKLPIPGCYHVEVCSGKERETIAGEAYCA